MFFLVKPLRNFLFLHTTQTVLAGATLDKILDSLTSFFFVSILYFPLYNYYTNFFSSNTTSICAKFENHLPIFFAVNLDK
tara:strand:- start:2314 stop:2553 length:240 start_codon:yes stop_codon:yes gene_type:complete